jgi:hypothetical protein
MSLLVFASCSDDPSLCSAGIRLKIMLPHDPEGKNGPRVPLRKFLVNVSLMFILADYSFPLLTCVLQDIFCLSFAFRACWTAKARLSMFEVYSLWRCGASLQWLEIYIEHFFHALSFRVHISSLPGEELSCDCLLG